MVKKRKSPVEKGVEELILKTIKEAKNQDRGPGADKLLAIARLLNSFARLRGGSPGPPGKPPGSSTPRREDMSTEQWQEFCELHGEPGYYESLGSLE